MLSPDYTDTTSEAATAESRQEIVMTSALEIREALKGPLTKITIIAS